MHVACSLQLKTHRLQKPVKCERSENLTAEDGKDDRYTTREQG